MAQLVPMLALSTGFNSVIRFNPSRVQSSEVAILLQAWETCLNLSSFDLGHVGQVDHVTWGSTLYHVVFGSAPGFRPGLGFQPHFPALSGLVPTHSGSSRIHSRIISHFEGSVPNEGTLLNAC